MKKTFLILSTLSFLFCFSTLCLASTASNVVTDSMNKTRSTINGAVEGVKNTAGHAANAVTNATNINDGNTGNARNAGNTGVTAGTGAGTSTGTGTGATRRSIDAGAARTDTTGYTAARTAATNAVNSTRTMWSWVIIGITTLAIAGFIWYYVSDANKARLRDGQ